MLGLSFLLSQGRCYARVERPPGSTPHTEGASPPAKHTPRHGGGKHHLVREPTFLYVTGGFMILLVAV